MLSYKKLFKRQLTNLLNGTAGMTNVAGSGGQNQRVVGHHLWHYDNDNENLWLYDFYTQQIHSGPKVQYSPHHQLPRASSLDNGTPVALFEYAAQADALPVRKGDMIIEIWSENGRERLFVLNRNIDPLEVVNGCQLANGVLVTLYQVPDDPRDHFPSVFLFTRLCDGTHYTLYHENFEAFWQCISLPPERSGLSLENYGLQLGLENLDSHSLVLHVSGFSPIKLSAPSRGAVFPWLWKDGRVRSADPAFPSPLPALSSRCLTSHLFNRNICFTWNGFVIDSRTKGAISVESWTFDPFAPDQTPTRVLDLPFPNEEAIDISLSRSGAFAFVSSRPCLECVYRPFAPGRRVFHLSHSLLGGDPKLLPDGSVVCLNIYAAQQLVFRLV